MKTLELTDASAKASVSLVPERGGIVTRFDVAGRALLYLDEATLVDPKQNVRGGVPILFPTPGKLAGDAFAQGGHEGAQKQHGFARTLAWEVVSHDDAHATLRLKAPDAWPWPCSISIRYSLAGAALTLDASIANDGRETMPFGFGLHPYFALPNADKPRVAIPTKATRAFDNVTKSFVDFHGVDGPQSGPVASSLDFEKPEVDMHLVDHGSSEAELVLPDGAAIRVAGSPEVTHWVVWSVQGKDFICLEPWTCPGNAMNTGERLLHVPAGAERRLRVEIALVARPSR